MSDINWDLAPEGAVEVRYNTRLGYIKFFNSEGERYVNGEWYAETVDEWQAIATRPQPEQPRKTVEDAVEWANGVWPSDDFIGIAYCSDENKFIPYMKGSPIDLGERKSRKAVCAREEFEACVAAKKYKSRLGCTVTWGQTNVPIAFIDKDGCEYELDDCSHGGAVYSKVKPTITKAEAWDKICESEHEFDIINRVKQLYTITK